MNQARPTPENVQAGADRKSGILLAVAGLLIILALALGLRLHFFVGCLGSDDLETWQLADALSKGRLAPDQIFQNPIAALRYGPAIPTAVVFRIFGNSERTVMVYPIVMSLLAVVAVWDITRRLGASIWAAHAAAIVMAITSLDIHYSTVFLPDGPLAEVSLLSIWCCIVGHEHISKTKTRRASLLLFTAGFLASFALMHKIAAAQLVAAIVFWMFSLAVLGKWHRAYAWIIVGLMCGVIFEHLLIWGAYGNPFHRWHTIYEESIQNTARRLEAATQPLPPADRLQKWLGMITKTLPAFTILAGAGLLAGLYYLVRCFKQPNVLLVSLYVLAVLGMRLPELTQTHSYQPRRLLPLAGGAAILLGFAIARRRRGRPVAIVTTMFLALLAGLFVSFDAEEIRKEKAKLSTERWLFDWTRRHHDLVEKSGLYVDHRTYKVLHVLSGFEDLRARGTHLHPSSVPDDYWIYGRRHPDFQDGAYFFENSRILEWLLPYSHAADWISFYPQLPESWPLLGIARHPSGQSYNAALYQIISTPKSTADITDPAVQTDDPSESPTDPSVEWSRDRLHQPAPKQYFGWYVIEPDGNTIELGTTPDGQQKLVVDFRKGERLQMFSGQGGPTKSSPESPLLEPGRSLRLSYSIRYDGEKSAGSLRTGLIGYDQAGGVSVRRFSNFTIGEAWNDCVVDLGDEPEVVGARAMIQFTGHGRYEIGPVKLARVSSVFPPDLQFHPEAGGMSPHYYGWYFKGPAEGHEITYLPASSDGPARIAIDSRTSKSLSLISGGPMTKHPPPSLFCRRGEYLKVTLPVHVDLSSLDRDWAVTELLVLGYARDGAPRKLYRARRRLYYPRQDLRAYIVAEDDLYGLKVSFELVGRGRVAFEEPKLEHFPNLPTDPVD